MKKIVLMALMFATGMSATAQDEVETTVAADVVSQYVWRGQDLGNVSLQPTLGIGYKGLSLSAWGSVGLADADDTKEFDLTLAYTIGGLNIGITDSNHGFRSDERNRARLRRVVPVRRPSGIYGHRQMRRIKETTK